jgi:LacI family transcriptional regulator, galactose operon repressor
VACYACNRLIVSFSTIDYCKRFHTNLSSPQKRRPRRSESSPRATLPTLRDVARAVGASTASVSRALNHPASVSEALLERIQQAARRLGYVPNAAGRVLSLKRSGLAGVIVPAIEHSLAGASVAALQRRFDQAGYSLVLAASGGRPERETACARAMISRGVEAMVLFGSRHEPELLQLLALQGVPYECLGALDDRLPCVGIDQEAAAAIAIRYLFDLGHRRFGVLTPSGGDNDLAVLAVPGYRDAFGGAGISAETLWFAECAHSASAARAAVRQLLEEDRRPTALLCGSDTLAVGVVREASERGDAVPGALSVVGFGDQDFVRHSIPALTTLRLPAIDMGVAAAERLLARLRGESPPAHVEVFAKLVVRGSTGPAPSR